MVDVGGVTSGQVDLGDIRKVSECGPEKEPRKPHSSMVSASVPVPRL